MDRRVGVERHQGPGGGMASAESQRQLDIAEKLCRKGQPQKAVPYLHKAMDDDTNLDAYIQYVLLQPTAELRAKWLDETEALGKKHMKSVFGPKVFDDNSPEMGHFWGLIETRPYMRVLSSKSEISYRDKKYKRAADACIECLRLCPGDNMGQRYSLGSLLIKANRVSDALSFAQAWTSPEAGQTGLVPRGGIDFRKPFSEPLSLERVEKLSRGWTATPLIYTAALAAFKLFGDTELARQYLKISAIRNPHVLMRILARRSQPDDVNRNPRAPDGPEDAHDYLYRAQDLWMAKDVWDWANGNEDAKALVATKCSLVTCGRVQAAGSTYQRCSGCKQVFYCSVACQKQDWKNHKQACQEQQHINALSRAVAKGKPPPRDNKMVYGMKDQTEAGNFFKAGV